eukprot:g6667.t1
MPRENVPLIKPMVPKHDLCIHVRAHSKHKENWKYHVPKVQIHARAFGYRVSDVIETTCDTDTLVRFVSVFVAVIAYEVSCGHAVYWQQKLSTHGVSINNWPVVWTRDSSVKLREDVDRKIDEDMQNTAWANQCPVKSGMKYCLRTFSSTVAPLRAHDDDRWTELYDLWPSRPVKVFTLGHDDCTRRKHSMKVANVFTEDWDWDNEGKTVLNWHPLPVQKMRIKNKAKEGWTDRAKTAEEAKVVYEVIGACFGPKRVRKMEKFSVRKDIDVDAWVDGEVPGVQVLLDQASYEMAAWQNLNSKLPLIYQEAIAHRGSNTCASTETGMRLIGRALRSFMRGPKGKRGNLGHFHDTRQNMIAEEADPNLPRPTWKYLHEAMAEQEFFFGVGTVGEMLKKPVHMQSSVNCRWWKCRYMAIFLQKNKYKLAMILSQQKPMTPAQAAAAAAAGGATDEDDLDLGEPSSDEEEDREMVGDAASLLRAMDPILKQPGLEECAIALSEEGHDYVKLLQNMNVHGAGTIMSQEVCERLYKWTQDNFADDTLAPTTRQLQLKLGQARWLNNRRILHQTMIEAGRHGKIGISESLGQLTQEVNFAMFQSADPNFGSWETIHTTQKEPLFRLPLGASLTNVLDRLPYESGSFARAMAELTDLGEERAVKTYLMDSYGSRPLFEAEQETCHKEKWSNNDRRCRVEGSNYSLQRDRILLAKKHLRYHAAIETPVQFPFPPDVVENDFLEQCQGYSTEQIRDIMRADGVKLSDAGLRKFVCDSATWLRDHDDCQTLEYVTAHAFFKNAPTSYGPTTLGFRGAEVLLQLRHNESAQVTGLRRSLSEKILWELKVPHRLREGQLVLVNSEVFDRTFRVLLQKDGVVICVGLEAYEFLTTLQIEQMQSQLAGGNVQGVVQELTWNYPVDDIDRVQITPFWADELDWYLSDSFETTNSMRKLVTMGLGDGVMLDSKTAAAQVAPRLTPAHKLLYINQFQGNCKHKLNADDLSFIALVEQTKLIDKLATTPGLYEKYFFDIKDARRRNRGFDVDNVLEIEAKQKKRKLDPNEKKAASQSPDKERKAREELGRQPAEFVSYFEVKDKGRVATVASHRTTGTHAFSRLKMTWDLDGVPTKTPRTPSRQWPPMTDPVKLCDEFVKYICKEYAEIPRRVNHVAVTNVWSFV